MTRTARRSLARPVEFTGPGVHTGENGRVRLLPADGGGIRFVTEDGTEIPADIRHVADTTLSVTLAKGDARVRTVEHLLAACHLLGITDLRMEVAGPELSVLDGSAWPFTEGMRRAGLRTVGGFVLPWTIAEPLRVADGSRFIEAFPTDRPILEVEIEYEHVLIRRQQWRGDLSRADLETELAPARTFGFMKEAERLRKQGFARGADPENTVIFTEHGLYEGELRFPDEPVRHKALDLLGDLWLLGRPLLAHVRAAWPGHELNVRFAREVLARGLSERDARPILCT